MMTSKPLTEQIEWLEANQGAHTDELKEQKNQLEEIAAPIITKLCGSVNAPPPSSHGHDEDSL